MKKGHIAEKQPVPIDLEVGKTYAWCACGLSASQPFCDGAHQKGDLKPMVFKAEKSETVWLCQCKQTGGSPYCDGAHKNL